jgi:hypothetical protein
MQTMLALASSRVSIAVAVVAAAATVIALAALVPGCGSSSVEVDKAAAYTPESLAAELALRFRALSPAAQAAKRTRSARIEKGRTERLARSEQAKNKVLGGAPANKKKQPSGLPLDDLLDDVENKLSLIKGMSRPEVCRKMLETISADTSLAQADREKLKELVNGMAEGS